MLWSEDFYGIAELLQLSGMHATVDACFKLTCILGNYASHTWAGSNDAEKAGTNNFASTTITYLVLYPRTKKPARG